MTPKYYGYAQMLYLPKELARSATKSVPIDTDTPPTSRTDVTWF